MSRADQPGLQAADLDYALPEAAIAQRPAGRRVDARLMLLARSGASPPEHHHMGDLPELLRGDELLVLNDTRVVRARLVGRKPTGGAVELLVLGPEAGAPGLARALGRASKPLRGGTPVEVAPGATVVVEASLGDGHFRVRLPAGADLWAFLEAHGQVPLPPYIRRDAAPDASDADRYQTVYAREPGSVAAPTAGLHFTKDLLEAIAARGCEIASVTLTVGPGTFMPIRSDRIADHVMHAERYAISPIAAEAIGRARATGRPVLAVGTTVVRTLEAAGGHRDGEIAPGASETDIFITPGFRFRVVDQLLTNFHLPRSTLLALVGAFAGLDRTLTAYRSAVAQGYRFYSYGDGMLLR